MFNPTTINYIQPQLELYSNLMFVVNNTDNTYAFFVLFFNQHLAFSYLLNADGHGLLTNR